MKGPIRRKPPSKRALEMLVFENGIGLWQLVLDVHFVQRGVFWRRGADCQLYRGQQHHPKLNPYICERK